MKRKGVIWLAVGLGLAIIAGLATFRILTQVSAVRASEQQVQTTTVVVALVDMGPRTVLTDTALALRQVPIEVVPVGAVTTLDEARGKLTLDAVSAGEILLSRRLADPTNKTQNIAFTMPEGKVAIALPGSDRLTRSGALKAGDKVDLLFTLARTGSAGDPRDLVTLAAIQNLEITAIVLPNVLAEAVGKNTLGRASDSTGTGEVEPVLLVAVDPQDALAIKYLIDAGAVMDVALRAATDEQVRSVESVTIDYMADRYQFTVPKDSGQVSTGGKE